MMHVWRWVWLRPVIKYAYVVTTDHREWPFQDVSYRKKIYGVTSRSKCRQFVICMGKI
jgi:hypothetical protein